MIYRNSLAIGLILAFIMGCENNARIETWTAEYRTLRQCLIGVVVAANVKTGGPYYSMKDARLSQDTPKEVSGYLTGKIEENLHLHFECEREETGTKGTFWKMTLFIDTERKKIPLTDTGYGEWY